MLAVVQLKDLGLHLSVFWRSVEQVYCEFKCVFLFDVLLQVITGIKINFIFEPELGSNTNFL